MTPAETLESGFSRWLEEVAGEARPHHAVRQGQPIAPYGTSMRVTKHVSGWLAAIDTGTPLEGERPEQKIVDLRAAGLVEPDAPPRLSTLGVRVLGEWRRLGAANTNEGDEVIRAAALVRAALDEGRPAYQGHLRFWIQLRNLRPANAWFDDPANLVLVTYLNRTDRSGYNPFRVLAAVGGGFAPYSEWLEWAEAMPVPNGWPSSRLSHVLSRVSGYATRPRGFVSYCMAMESVYLAAVDPATLLQHVSELVDT